MYSAANISQLSVGTRRFSSSDGRWLAYQSDQSSQYEIYVRPFPNVEDEQWLISNGGGTQPLWAPDGRELFYLGSWRETDGGRC